MLNITYRPKTFNEVIGQKEVVESIKSILQQKEIPHAFLFVGDSGLGKTTMARIIANIIGGGNNEILEINVANANGVDYFRHLEETAKYAPLIGNNKIYILDEVHQMTKESQNMLLKLLEEPPKHVYFCLCTTEISKLIPTLRNRCNIYTLKPLSNKDIELLLKQVIKDEDLNLSEDILNLLIYKAEGCPRKALVMLNQVRSVDDFESATKLLADELDAEADIIDLCRLIIKRPKTQWKDIVKIFEALNLEPETIRITIAGYLAACLKKAGDPSFHAEKLELFLSPLTFGSQKSELIFLIYKSWNN